MRHSQERDQVNESQREIRYWNLLSRRDLPDQLKYADNYEVEISSLQEPQKASDDEDSNVSSAETIL